MFQLIVICYLVEQQLVNLLHNFFQVKNGITSQTSTCDLSPGTKKGQKNRDIKTSDGWNITDNSDHN